MKRRDLEAELLILGYVYVRSTGRHDVWKLGGRGKNAYVPRHREINEITAQEILKSARTP